MQQPPMPQARPWQRRRPHRQRAVAAWGAALVALATAAAVSAGDFQDARLECASGSKLHLVEVGPDGFEELLGQPARRTLTCVDGLERGDGPALRFRFEITEQVARSIGPGPWRRGMVALVGQLRAGVPVGLWRQYDAVGREIGHSALDAAGTGLWQEVHDDGTPKVQGQVQRGQRVGMWRWWQPDGARRAEARYEAGTLAGEALIFGEAEQVETRVSFRGGRRHGSFTSHWPSGYKRWDGAYDESMRDGPWCAFGDRGLLLGCNTLRRGEGDWIDWSPSGAIIAAGPLVEDRRHGAWSSWYEEGALRDVARYEAGRLLHRDVRRYAADGTDSSGRIVLGAASGPGLLGGAMRGVSGPPGTVAGGSVRAMAGGLGGLGLLRRGPPSPQARGAIPPPYAPPTGGGAGAVGAGMGGVAGPRPTVAMQPPTALGALRPVRTTAEGRLMGQPGRTLAPRPAVLAQMQAMLGGCYRGAHPPGTQLRATFHMTVTATGALVGPDGAAEAVSESSPDGQQGPQVHLSAWAHCVGPRLRALRLEAAPVGPLVVDVVAEVL